jgi:glycosyltransferase involved in cell wall biosynthesis
MKVAFVGDFINHGKFLVPTGTSIVLLLSKIPDIEVIDVYCPILNNKTEPFKEPVNVRIIESYKYDNPVSIIKLLKVGRKHYDRIIFNIMPTAFGNSSLANLTGLLVPLMLRVVFRKKNIEIIYHNSVYTNDISKLGYDSSYDKLRSHILSIVERVIFKSVRTFVFLEFYKDKITRRIGKNHLRVLNGRYLEAITTIYLNGFYNYDYLPKSVNHNPPQVLMHGYWGPQKNIELGLDALAELGNNGVLFELTISGSINSHFKEYEERFDLLLEKYKKILKKYEGFVNEIGVMNLFKNSDLLILPYNTPGGRSAVLEQAIFFEVQTIAIDFPEFREQADKIRFITLINSGESLKSFAKKILLDREVKNTEINVKGKIQQAITNIQKLLE